MKFGRITLIIALSALNICSQAAEPSAAAAASDLPVWIGHEMVLVPAAIVRHFGLLEDLYEIYRDTGQKCELDPANVHPFVLKNLIEFVQNQEMPVLGEKNLVRMMALADYLLIKDPNVLDPILKKFYDELSPKLAAWTAQYAPGLNIRRYNWIASEQNYITVAQQDECSHQEFCDPNKKYLIIKSVYGIRSPSARTEIIDLKTATVYMIFYQPGDYKTIYWSPDGQRCVIGKLFLDLKEKTTHRLDFVECTEALWHKEEQKCALRISPGYWIIYNYGNRQLEDRQVIMK